MVLKNEQVFALIVSLLIPFCLSAADVHNPQTSEDEAASDKYPDLFHHHDYEQMVGLMTEVNKKCPDVTRIYSLSEPSVEGRNLTVLEISENPGVHVPGNLTCHVD